MSGIVSTKVNPLALDQPDNVRRVRDVLDRAGFDDRQILERMGMRDSADLSFGPIDRPRVLRRTRQGDPLSTLIRLFLAGVPVPMVAFRRAVEPMAPAVWEELGLVEIAGEMVRRCVVIRPFEGVMIAHDAALADGSTRSDHVLGVTGTTSTLARAMMQLPAERTLDLGTGGGYLAIVAARNSRHVLGTDLNRRALAMAEFNVLLNRVENVELAAGDLYEPVGDRRFDLIVSNPPFVVSPESEVLFRDSGLVGDEVCEQIIRRTAPHLAEGGFAQILCNWVRIAGGDWVERLTSWFDGSGCDVWIIQTMSLDPADYAHHWLGRANASAEDRFAERFDRWMAYYDRQGIEAIDFGLVNLRRRTAERNWIQFDTDRRHNHPNGAAIHAGFAARDLIGRLKDVSSWLRLRLRCHPELRLLQRLEPAESGWRVGDADCHVGAGLRFEGNVNPTVFHLLTLCRGRETLSEVLTKAADRVGRDPEEFLSEGLEAARGLVEQGFLWPADQPLGPSPE